MMRFATLGLACAMALTSLTGAHAQVQGQAYKSPEDCIADYGRLDTNNDGIIDNTESSKYMFIREDVDVNGDGMISADERRVACERGIAKAFRVPQ